MFIIMQYNNLFKIFSLYKTMQKKSGNAVFINKCWMKIWMKFNNYNIEYTF